MAWLFRPNSATIEVRLLSHLTCRRHRSNAHSKMKLSSLLLLPTSLLSAVYASPESGSYNEHLHLQPLPGGSLYAGFNFTATTPLSAYDSQHFRFFPRSLAQILQYTHTAELHLRFSLGRWDEESWGSRPRAGLREGGNGVELWAWLEGSEDVSAASRWSDLVNSLSGLFCASLNFIDSGKTVRPLLSFEPEGTLDALSRSTRRRSSRSQGQLELLHGMLPHEVVCTENLTPYLKLLPCKGKAGIASLLDGHKVFDANWQTMSVDVRPICSASGEDCVLEIQQTIDMVLDIERAMRSRDDPIPRPLPIEEIQCDESKGYHAADTCYPMPHEGEREWSLERIFGRAIRGSCPLATAQQDKGGYDVTLEVPSERTVEVLSEARIQQSAPGGGTRHYRLPEGRDFDLSLPRQTISHQRTLSKPPMYASRQITGYGGERGGMHTTLHNPHPYAQRIVYLENLPWFLRPYMHTLNVAGGKIEKMYYTPLLDRKRGTHLELLIEVPAQSSVELTYDFEKAILRYTEYPPDANRGFDIPAAIIRVLPNNNTSSLLSPGDSGDYYLRTTSLLLPLPTPDFSMPYNVIILTSTVIALGFGSIFNLLVRRFVLVEEVPVSPVAVAVRKVVGRVREAGEQLRERFMQGRETLRANANAAPSDGNEHVKATGSFLENIDGGNGVGKSPANGRLKGPGTSKKDR